MRTKFIAYAIFVVLATSLASWSGLGRRATGGRGSGNSWNSGPGYSGGGWASGGGGGHK